ncbi:MAG: argininosuccinate lyase [Thermoplasmata archaeon]
MNDVSGSPTFVRTAAAPYLASLGVDRALARFDVAGSIVHAEMLGRVGIIPPSEAARLISGLRGIHADMESGRFAWREELEDVHTNVEVALTERVGAIGGKLHSARSRNDQIALDERLWLRRAVRTIGVAVTDLRAALLERASQQAGAPMPGYTHLQRAQLVSIAHQLLAHQWRLARDFGRLIDCARRADVSPLGAGALAGTSLPIDPMWVANRLGFSQVFQNSLDAVSDRDYFAEYLFALTLLAIHLSSLGEEITLWATQEFGFLLPTPEMGSGSSLMPQKRNPDVAELGRAKAARVLGDLVGLLAVLKGLPLAYNRDLQEDKAPVFDATVQVRETLEAFAQLVPALQFDLQRINQAARDPRLFATDIVEQRTREGVPFRQAHEEVAKQYAHEGGSAGGSPVSPEGADPVEALRMRSSPGGPSPRAVQNQLERARESLDHALQSLSELHAKDERVEEILREK